MCEGAWGSTSIPTNGRSRTPSAGWTTLGAPSSSESNPTLPPPAEATEAQKENAARTRDILRQMTSLHQRVALLAMTDHAFLDENFTRERTTFADGTTVTVDWTAKTVAVSPPLP